MAEPINNALSNYDNEVTETSSGSSGFIQKGISAIGNAAGNRLSGKLNGIADKVSSGVKSFADGRITQLNALAERVAGKFNIKIPIDLKSYMTDYLNQGLDMLKTMANDGLNKLKDAAITYVGNIAEQFTKSVKSAIYITDEIFSLGIKGLYYTGADLAYHDHYIRTQALSRDWVKTLEFCDGEYEIDYNIKFSRLSQDIQLCASNSCFKNLLYIFDKLYAQYITFNKEIERLETDIALGKGSDKKYTETEAYKIARDQIAEYKKNIEFIKSLIVNGTKTLIVYSYTYLTPTKLRKFFDLYGDIVTPRMFGTSDKVYNRKYFINSSDLDIMMPIQKKHEESETDKMVNTMMAKQLADQIADQQGGGNYLLNKVNSLTGGAIKNAVNGAIEAGESEIMDFGSKKLNEVGGTIGDRINNSSTVKSLREAAAGMGLSGYADSKFSEFTQKGKDYLHAQAQNGIGTLKNNVMGALFKQSETVSMVALMQGADEVAKQSKKKYKEKGQNDIKNKVKYRDKGLDTALEDAFEDDIEGWVLPRNSNIKQIYVLLSSRAIFGEERMINEGFYKRCKYPTEESNASALDKAKAILGSALAIQAGYGAVDALEASAYNYCKQFEDYMLDPAKNIGLDGEVVDQVVNSTFKFDPNMEFDPNVDDPVTKEELETIFGDQDKIYDLFDTSSDNDSVHGVNHNTNVTISEKLKNSMSANNKLVSYMRYVSNIPMIEKRDMIISWLTRFYNSMEKYAITGYQNLFETLVTFVFGYKNIREPGSLIQCFNYSTNISLNDNCKILVGIDVLNYEEVVFDLGTNEQKNKIIHLFKMAIRLFENNIRNEGFAKSVFLYDYEFLSSYLKTLYDNARKVIKKINDKTNTFVNVLYSIKDLMTTKFVGFDRKGIFGYDLNTKRIKYTNVETGDWMSCIASKENGTFFGGSDNTKNNGIWHLNESTNELEQMNVTSGNWVSIQEYGKYVFFINDENEIWFLSNSKIYKSNVSDAQNYEFKYISSLGIVLLCGTNDNGFKYWDMSKFNNGADRGSEWKFEKIESSGYLIYASDAPGSIWSVNYTKKFQPCRYNTIRSITNLVYFVEDNIYKTQSNSGTGSSTGSGENGQQQESEAHTYDLYVMGGTPSGDPICLHTRHASGLFNLNELENFDDPDSIINGLIVPITIEERDGTFVFATNTGVKWVQFQTENNSNSIGYNSPPNPSHNSISNSLQPNSIAVTKCVILDNYIMLNDQSNNIRRMAKKDGDLVPYEPTVSISDNEFVELNGIVFSRSKTDKLGYKTYDSAGHIHDAFASGDMSKDEWTLVSLDETHLFATNKKNALGIRYFQNIENGFVGTDINKGSWILSSYEKTIIAASNNNSNLGVRVGVVQTGETNTCQFVDISHTTISDGDFGALVTDPNRKIIYILSYRDKLVYDIDKISYDIDEFVYSIHNLKKEYTIREFHNSFLGILHDVLEKAYDNRQDIEKTSTDLYEIIDLLNAFMLSIEKASDIYNDLMFYAEARTEFDVDDNEVLNNLLVDFITNYDYEGVNLNRDEEISAAMAAISSTEYVIHSRAAEVPVLGEDESQEDFAQRVSAFNEKHSTLSDEYMNSDSDEYDFHTREMPSSDPIPDPNPNSNGE